MRIKNIILSIILFLNFVLVQNSAFSQEQNIYMTAYLVRLQNRVKSNWVQPHAQAGKKTIVVFDIDKNGDIINSSVSQSSGDKEFDELALLAISKTTPFEKFPQSINDENIKINFVFSQNSIEATQALGEKMMNEASKKSNENNYKSPNNTRKIAKNIDFAPYMRELQRDIKSNWAPPKFQKHKVAVISFTISKSGELSDMKIYKSSGNKGFDKKAIDAISNTAPFAPLPDDFNVSSIDIKFTFNYNLSNSNSERTSIIFNNYYFVPSDFSSPITRIWALDKVVWWAFLVLKICSPSI